MKLNNRFALITGGGRGIGRAIAFALAREGANVAVAARTREQIEKVASEIGDEIGTQALAVECDVGYSESVAEALERVKGKFGRGPDILVNNAGIAESAPFLKTDRKMWERHLVINLGGTLRCTQAMLPEMIERGWGRVINIASIAGKTGAPYISAYSASKHAVLGLTRSLALEVAEKNQLSQKTESSQRSMSGFLMRLVNPESLGAPRGYSNGVLTDAGGRLR